MHVNYLDLPTKEIQQNLQQNGYAIIPFSTEIAYLMKKHICSLFSLDYDLSLDDRKILENLTKKVMSFSDEEFIQKLAKPFRFFPASVTEAVVEWVSSLQTLLQGTKTGVNFICKNEYTRNPTLHKHSYDIFFRCVRPNKPDVGKPHCDYQFWELAKGTDDEALVPFSYDIRWKIWAPLFGCNENNCLQVVPKSHLEDVPIEEIKTENGLKPKIADSWLSKAKFVIPFEDFFNCCVLFHDKLVHKGPKNPGDFLRLSGELTILAKK